MMKKLCLAAIAASFLLAGCNTMQGLGQDLKKGAEHVSTAIGKAGDKLSDAASSSGGTSSSTSTSAKE